MISSRMMWTISGFVLTLLLVTPLWAFIGKDKVWRHNLSDAETESRQLDRPLLMHFHASWCGPCRQMEASVLNSGDVKNVLLERVVGIKIDFDEHPEVAEKYGVTLLPADVIVSPDGKILKKSVGFQNREQYVGNLLGAERQYASLRPQPVMPPVARQPVIEPSEIQQPEIQQPEIQQAETSATAPQDLARPAEVVVALEGYCPVTLWRTRQWVRGKTAFGADYQGVRYYFNSLEDRDDFIAQPVRYAPQLLGCDPVTLWETERAIAGSSQFAAYFDGELYLFRSLVNRDRFKSSPPQFTKTRHVKLEEIERADTRIGMNK